MQIEQPHCKLFQGISLNPPHCSKSENIVGVKKVLSITVVKCGHDLTRSIDNSQKFWGTILMYENSEGHQAASVDKYRAPCMDGLCTILYSTILMVTDINWQDMHAYSQMLLVASVYPPHSYDHSLHWCQIINIHYEGGYIYICNLQQPQYVQRGFY